MSLLTQTTTTKKMLTEAEINPRWMLQLQGIQQPGLDINIYNACIVGEAYENHGMQVDERVDNDDPYKCGICKEYANKFIDFFTPINRMQEYTKSSTLIDDEETKTEFNQVRAGFYTHFNLAHVK